MIYINNNEAGVVCLMCHRRFSTQTYYSGFMLTKTAKLSVFFFSAMKAITVRGWFAGDIRY